MRKLLPCILLLSLLLPGCGNKQPVVREAFLLDTFVSVTLYDGDEEQAQEVLDLCRSYEDIFSRTDPDSELYRLNHREITQVSNDLAEIIALGLDYAARTGGAFDITTGSITSLWDFSAETPQIPDPVAVSEGLTHVGWEKVDLSGNTVTFSDPGTMIDLGGIARATSQTGWPTICGRRASPPPSSTWGVTSTAWEPSLAAISSRWASSIPTRTGRPSSALCPPRICRW